MICRRTESNDILLELVAKTLAVGATEMQVEYEDREEHVLAFQEGVGFGAPGVHPTAFGSLLSSRRPRRSHRLSFATAPIARSLPNQNRLPPVWRAPNTCSPDIFGAHP